MIFAWHHMYFVLEYKEIPQELALEKKALLCYTKSNLIYAAAKHHSALFTWSTSLFLACKHLASVLLLLPQRNALG